MVVQTNDLQRFGARAEAVESDYFFGVALF